VLAVSFASIAPELTPLAFDRWLASSGVEPGRSDGLVMRLGEFRALHAAVVEALGAMAAGTSCPATAITRLNETAALVPFAPRLRAGPGRTVLEDEPRGTGRAVDVLAAIARSAIRLVGSADASRLRRCPACASFFLASRPDRVWCGQACGNRARVARHHARRRAGTASPSPRRRGATGRPSH
jgi:predicted RNA-binding Zn ribbon-like protein